MLQKPRGTRDFLPDEMEARRAVEWRLREVARRWGYREICTPEFEDLELFTMRSGEGIIEEMYVFEDKGGRKLALRPEITAAVIRMYINEAKVAPKPLRWCYFADCFRYERPQKGRYRQFWQFGVELIGADTAAADAETVMLASEMLTATGVLPLSNWKVVVVTVAGSSASLKVAVTVVLTVTPLAPLVGVRPVTVGGVVSGPALLVNTTSTQ